MHETDNPELLCYSKRSPDGANAIVVVVNLDPVHVQHGHVLVPLSWLHGDTPERFVMHDLLTDVRFEWGGNWNHVRPDPADMPAHVLCLERG